MYVQEEAARQAQALEEKDDDAMTVSTEPITEPGARTGLRSSPLALKESIVVPQRKEPLLFTDRLTRGLRVRDVRGLGFTETTSCWMTGSETGGGEAAGGDERFMHDEGWVETFGGSASFELSRLKEVSGGDFLRPGPCHRS
jgi:hypothetical protein